jgi:hypothetical protein
MRSTIIILALVTITACNEIIGERGNDERVTREITVDSFDKIEISGAFEVTFTSSNSHEVILEADENLLKYIEIGVRGNRLYLETDRRLSSRKGIKIEVPIQELRVISSSGASDLISSNQISTDDLEIDISGAGKVDLKLDAAIVKLNLSGAALVYLEGMAKELEVVMSGAGSLEAAGLEVGDCSISISGVGSALVNVSGRLDASVSGLGKVEYTGSPTAVHGDVSGVGNVKRAKN